MSVQTDISYQIVCNTKSRGLRAIEAYPKSDSTGLSTPKDDMPDQVWRLKPRGTGYEIECDTTNRGLRYLEAYPKDNQVRVVEKNSSTDQIWHTEKTANGIRIFCNTKNGGKRYLEAYPADDWVRPRPFDPSNVDQMWTLKPICYELKALVFQVEYHQSEEELRKKYYRVGYLEESIIQNPSPHTELEAVSTYIRQCTNTVSLTFKEGFKIGTEIEFTAGVPEVASMSAKLSMEVSVEFNQEYTETNLEEVSFVRIVRVRPGGCVLVKNAINIMTGVETEATLSIKFSAVDNKSGKSIDATGVKQILKDKEIDVKYLNINRPNEVMAQKDCVFKGDYKVSSFFSVTEIDATSIVPTTKSG